MLLSALYEDLNYIQGALILNPPIDPWKQASLLVNMFVHKMETTILPSPSETANINKDETLPKYKILFWS